MDLLLIVLLLIVVIQLTIIILLLRVRFLDLRRRRFIDPSFPAFDEEFVLRARSDLAIAKEIYRQAREAAYKEVRLDGKTETKWTHDIGIYRKFAEAELAENLEMERLHKLVESNLAVVRGEKISKVIKEYNDWLRNQIEANAKTVDEAVRRFDAKLKAESGQPSKTGASS